MKHTELFLLRLWTEQESAGEPQWCGKVQHVVTGEVHIFHTWPMLEDLLLAMISGPFAGQGTERSRSMGKEGDH